MVRPSAAARFFRALLESGQTQRCCEVLSSIAGEWSDPALLRGSLEHCWRVVRPNAAARFFRACWRVDRPNAAARFFRALLESGQTQRCCEVLLSIAGAWAEYTGPLGFFDVVFHCHWSRLAPSMVSWAAGACPLWCHRSG